MANVTGLIPTGEALKGKSPVLHIKRQEDNPALGQQRYDFGALLDMPTKLGDKEFPLTGWIGASGKTVPVVAEYNANPGMSTSGEHERPAIRIFMETDGDLLEIAVGFRKAGRETGKEFYSGNTTGTPKKNLVFFKHEKKAEAQGEGGSF